MSGRFEDRDSHVAEQRRRARGADFTYTVEGFGDFPWDMLRRDRCWPATEDRDSYGLRPASVRRRVALTTNLDSAPLVERWASFGWRVVGPGELRDMADPGPGANGLPLLQRPR